MALPSSVITRLRTQHLDIQKILSDISNDLLYKKKDNAWSIFDHLIHLAVMQPRFIHRISELVSGQASVFSTYDAKKDPLFEEYHSLEPQDIWDRIQERREDLISIIESLTDAQLTIKGKHDLYGTMSVAEGIDFFLLHEAHHIYRMLMLKLDYHPSDIHEMAES